MTLRPTGESDDGCRTPTAQSGDRRNGAIAHAHAQAIADLAPRIELVAVADVDIERARVFADAFAPPATVYTSLSALLAAERIDLVHICTPPQTHVPLASRIPARRSAGAGREAHRPEPR